MPYINTDWKDEVIEFIDTDGSTISTAAWTCEMHIRTRPGATPATLILKTDDNTLLVGQATDSGSDNGISPNVAAAAMTMTPGLYQWDLKRTDGGRNEWVIGGTVEFDQPITVIGLT